MFLNRPRLDLTITQASTFSGARQALFWVTTLPAILNTRSLLLLATGMGKMTLTKKARRGRDSFHFHHGWDLCLSNIFYKQISRPQCMKLTKFMSWEGNPERSHTVLVKSQDKNFRQIPSQKIPGSRDFAKSNPGNPRIENSWSHWSLLVGQYWLVLGGTGSV